MKTPSKRKYEAMIANMANILKISFREAEKHTEYEYYLLIAEINLQSEREEYIMKSTQNENGN